VEKEGVWGEYTFPDKKVSELSPQTREEELQDQPWRLTEHLLSEKLGELPYK
jgi:hypothetical protein